MKLNSTLTPSCEHIVLKNISNKILSIAILCIVLCEPCISKQVIQLGAIVVALGSALALLGPGMLRLRTGRLGVPGSTSLTPRSPAALVVAARGLAGDRADGRVAGVGVGAAGGDLAAGVVRLVRGDAQLVAVVVLAAAEIQVITVRVAAHGQPGLSLVAAAAAPVRSNALQRTDERWLIIWWRAARGALARGTTYRKRFSYILRQ